MTTDKPDLVAVLEHYGSNIPDRHGYISVRCVLHEDTLASATVNIDKQRYHCFVCSFDGDVYDVVARKEDIGDFKDVIARAEAIADGKRKQVSRSTGSSDGLLPARSGNRGRSRRYVPPRYGT